MYIGGFDPGYVALGGAFMDEDTCRTELTVNDLETWRDGGKHVLRERDFCSVILDMLIAYEPFLRNTRIVCIERQPGFGASKVRQVGFLLEGMIMARYPDIEVFAVSPVSVKNYYAVVEAEYPDRKLAVMDACMTTGMIRPADLPGLQSTFTRTFFEKGRPASEFKVDGVEAGMLCWYILANLDKERKLKIKRDVGFEATTVRLKLKEPVITKEMRKTAAIKRKLLREQARAEKKTKKLAPKAKKVPIKKKKPPPKAKKVVTKKPVAKAVKKRTKQ